MKITRRGVLLGVLAASGGVLAYQRFPWEVAQRSEMHDFLFRLLEVVAVPHPLKVGEAHLRATPGLKGQPQKLLDAVFTDLLPLAPRGTVEELATAMRDKARRQFETGDVMTVSTWILARAEVELCALIALDRRPVR
ncbi:MAG: hypothetical protein GY719_04645 [bacterium]|nr:hypothetical protein [bacterium]